MSNESIEPGTERRVHERVPLKVAVTMSSTSNFYAGITNDISEGGLFVATTDPPPANAEVEMTLSLPIGEPFVIEGVVCWVRGKMGGTSGVLAGCGIRFTKIAEDSLVLIREFVEQRDTMLYEDGSLQPPAEIVKEKIKSVSDLRREAEERYVEQRQHERVPLKVAVNMGSASNFYAGITNNISEGGLFVATKSSPPMGTMVEMMLSLPGNSEPFRVEGEVRWICNSTSESEAGCGIRWTSLSPDALNAIKRFIEKRDTLLYEENE